MASILYSFLLDPNIVFLLFVLAMLGFFVEISHPGAIFPAVIGTIAFILFVFAAGSLPLNWAGFALMLLAGVLLVLDVKLPGHGVLTVGAVFSLIIGSLLFFNTSGSQVQPLVVYVTGAAVGVVGIALGVLAMRVRRKKVTTGIEGMIGSHVTALTPLLPEGRVRYNGENWVAVMDSPDSSADPGSELRIVAVEGLRLRVGPLRPSLLVSTRTQKHASPKEI